MFESVNIKLTLFSIVFILSSTFSYTQWERITSIPSAYRNNIGWLEFWFLQSDNNYGWLCGFEGKVIRTTDKGKTWKGTIIQGASQLESICFADRLVGYVSGTKVSYDSWGRPYEIGAIYKSVDGGSSWKEITDTRRNSVLWGNYFLDKDNGIVVGGSCGEMQQFFKTTNGGRTWSLFEANPGSETGLSDVELAADGRGWAVSSGMLWITNDGGSTWSQFKNTGNTDWQEDLHLSGNTILVPYSTGCSGNDNSGGVRLSTDMGNTWRQHITFHPMFGGWLLSDIKGWACGHSATAIYTSNAGKTWENLNCGIDPGEVVDDFWFFDDTTGFVCGKEVYRFSPRRKIISNIIPSSLTACSGDTIMLSSDNEYFNYEWSTGSNDSSIKVVKSGKIILTAYNTLCDTLVPDTIDIVFNPKPTLSIEITNNPVVCEGDSIILYAKSDTPDLLWSTSETSDSIIVKTEGTYSVEATNSFGCKIKSDIYIRVSALPKPDLTLIGRAKFCIGDSTEISATPGYSKYHWSDGSGNQWTTNSNTIKVGSTGIYKCLAENEDGCIGGGKDSITVTVDNETNRISFVFPTDREFVLDSAYFPETICRDIILFNATSKSQNIDLPYIFKNKSFSFPLSQFPQLLNPGDTLKIAVCYSPSDIGIERDTVIINDFCNPHILALKGISFTKLFISGSICNADVIARTIDIPGKYSFSTSTPYPNPASFSIAVDFIFIGTENSKESENAVLYDIFGQRIRFGEKSVSSSDRQDDFIINRGQFRIDLHDLDTGTYLLIVTTEAGAISYNIRIIK